ncbi:hypothetical protein [Pseudorhodoferax sp.]|uniref:hypothetical protein n=1 Tax=Pseudorhodoferax sp. TaxID=1993553 RepID=UPI002DD6743D|nr:hypothetical protein [Pseudorhodoferax sp.]
MTRYAAASLLIVLGAATGCATEPYRPTTTATSLRALVAETWKLPNFNFSRNAVSSTYSMRVSTYSSPPFIHAQQMQPLAEKSLELQTVCGREGGNWTFLAPTPHGQRAPEPGARHQNLASATAAITSRPLESESQMRSEIAALARANQLDLANQVFEAILAAARSRPDALTEEALAHAERLKWFGTFECRKPEASWKATIAAVGWKSSSDRNYVYRDVTLNTAFFGVR